ncbi:hypothetical protein RJ45_05095 [Photobacterium gaetbulicola]|uniref:N-acetyltransferase domain-containing protein n=1 Tax=Photobacterium gaetbulicola TaxID=1295392 RepID=A0A0B9GIX1_9GAMM|nr:GNAT family N-acetyltransferase [Photobacterium gaetbulicola]KHT64685.1 hypothetical protein RJ45_05095 [Photobacterium gaetbulicola]
MIKTDRLILTPVTHEDMDIYTELLTSKEITKYLPGGKPFSPEYIEQYVPKKVEHWAKGFGMFFVSLRGNPAVKIGYAGVEVIPDVNLSDIRYAISSEYQGLGYASEAAQAAIDFVFSAGALDAIYGVAVVDNLPSVKLLRKLGMHETDVRLYDSDDLITMLIQART